MNGKLEAVERGILGRCESYRNKRNQYLAEENIAFAVRSELVTLETDLAISQAAKELVAWEKKNHFAGSVETPFEWLKLLENIRATVEKGSK